MSPLAAAPKGLAPGPSFAVGKEQQVLRPPRRTQNDSPGRMTVPKRVVERKANANGEQRLLCDPRGQPPCGSHLLSHRLNVRCPNVGAAFQTPRVHRQPAFGEGALEAVLRLGRNEPRLRTSRPAQTRLPSLRSVAFHKRNRNARASEPLPLMSGWQSQGASVQPVLPRFAPGWTHRVRKAF